MWQRESHDGVKLVNRSGELEAKAMTQAYRKNLVEKKWIAGEVALLRPPTSHTEMPPSRRQFYAT